MSSMTPQTDRFSFWISFKQSISLMKSDALKLAAYEIMTDYAFWGIEPKQETTPPELLIWFELVRPNIDTSVKYVAYGKTGGRPKKTPLKTPLKTEVEAEKEVKKEFEKESKGEAETKDSVFRSEPYTLNDIKEICSLEHIKLSMADLEAIQKNTEFKEYPAKLLRWYEKNPEEIAKIKRLSELKAKAPATPPARKQPKRSFSDQRVYEYDELEKKLYSAGMAPDPVPEGSNE